MRKLFSLCSSGVVLALLSVWSTVYAGNGPRFMENKGQFPDQVEYQLRVANADIFFEKDRLVFHFMDAALFGDHGHNHDKSVIDSDGPNAHAYYMVFENANPQVQVQGKDAYRDVTNYFRGNDPSKWASGVKAYERLHYEGIYPGIDLHYFEHEGTLKYDLFVAPHIDASTIAMRYEGVDAIFLKGGKLHIKNTFNEVIEMRPVAYQNIDGHRVEVACEFTLKGSTVGFSFPDGFDSGRELIIDPTLIFSSYSGSTSDNFGFTATYDDNGALYGGGITFGGGYPFITGSYTTGFVGQADMAISKFSADGSILEYSCIIGGTWGDAPHSMVVNGNGELVILGSTASTNYPVSGNAYDSGFNGGVTANYSNFYGLNYNGGSDLVITVLGADGSSLVGSTYFGGSGNDGINQDAILAYNYGDHFRGEVIVDENDDIHIISSTRSSNLPVTPGAFDQTFNGTQDAVIAKFNPDVSALEWCSYLGGNGADAGYSLKQNSSGEIYAVGGTVGQNFQTSVGALNANYQGGISDGYIARISSDGSALVHSTFIGTNQYDQTYFVEVDDADDVYVYGQSLGTYPVSSGVYSNTNGRQFIHKVSPDLGTSLVSTVFGSGGNVVNVSPTAFLVDVCNRIYISGWGGATNNSNFSGNTVGNTNGLAVTSNAFQSTTDGSDFYFMVLEADATSLLYGTYFGGAGIAEHVDGGTSRFNSSGVIHQAVCAGCGGSSAFPTTPGVVSNTNNASNCNLGVIKLDMEITGVNVEITAGSDTEGCAPLPVQFTSQLINTSDVVWDFGDGNTSTGFNPTHTYTTPGTYVVSLIGIDTVLCTGGLYADTAYTTVIVNDIAIPADAGVDETVCNGASVQIGVPETIGYSYSWSPSLALSDPTSAQPDATPSSTQTYTLTVTDENGCQSTDQVLVDVFDVQASGDTLICPGSGSVPLSATSAANWLWSPAGLLDDPAAQNPNATVTSTTVFTLEADDGAGCTVTQQVTVTVAPEPIANAGPNQTVCLGESATLSASGGQQYQWNPGTYLSNPSIASPTSTPDADITYEVTITDANGCDATDEVDVFVNPLPVVSASPELEICEGGDVQLQANGAQTYSWSPALGLDDALSATPIATPATATVYTVTGTDVNGCVNSDSVAIDIFSVNLSNDTIVCIGESVQLAADNGVSWTWSPAGLLDNPNAQNPVATVTAQTVFTATVSNGQGCSLDRQVTVDVFAQPIANAGPDQSVCIGESVTLNASGGQQYQWSPATYLDNPSIASPNSTPASDITYQLTIVDANGCEATDDVSVNVDPLPVVTASPSIEVCEGSNVQLQANGALSYSWSPADGLDDPLSVSPLATPEGTTTYTVTGTDANGCVNTASVTIDVFTVNVSNDTVVCPGQTVQLSADNGTSWTWIPGDVLDDPLTQNPTATVSAPTTFTVAVSNGQCFLLREVTVDVFDPAVANAGIDREVCFGTPLNLNGQGGETYLWSPATYLDDATLSSPGLNAVDDITYQLTVVDANGCTDSDEVSIAVNPLPVAVASDDVEICVGGSTQLLAEGGVEYAWSPTVAMDDPNIANPTVSPSVPTTYLVTVTDINGCSAMDSTAISIFTITAQASPDASVCLGDSVLVTASGGQTFSWSPTSGVRDTLAQSTYITPIGDGIYIVTATSSGNCQDTAQVHLHTLALPQVSFDTSFTPTCEGVLGRVIDRSTGADVIHWEFSVAPDSSILSDVSFIFPNGQGPVITLFAIDELSGCGDSLTLDLSGQFFTNDSVKVFYPNVITPNDDGFNDCFKPGFHGAFSDCYELKVFNRWGALIFESVGSGDCWNGRTKGGNTVIEGTYYYIAKVLEEEKAGWVQVIRP